MFTIFHSQPSEFASLHERKKWARSIDGLLRNADRPMGGLHPRGVRPIYTPQVVYACAPQLRDIRDVLLDVSVDVPTSRVRSLQEFICEGSISPLLGPDPDAARRRASELRAAFTMAKRSPKSDRVTVAA